MADRIPLYQVDAFADRPFGGNPAAVCVLSAPANDAWMQAVATEMNLSETAFVRPVDADWEIRWFTPAAEVELCGHATLATAHVLWATERAPAKQPLRFATRYRGVLTCRLAAEGEITMDFPADPPAPADPPPGLLATLGAPTATHSVARSRYDWLIELASESDVRAVAPDFAALSQFETRGILLTAAANDASDFDFVSRFFAPRLRINEDPVTGSAHCILAPYWANRLAKPQLRGYQASERGGIVSVRIEGDRVHLGGRAVTVVEGAWVG